MKKGLQPRESWQASAQKNDIQYKIKKPRNIPFPLREGLKGGKSLKARLQREHQKSKPQTGDGSYRKQHPSGLVDDLSLDLNAARLSDGIAGASVTSALLPISDTESDFEERVSRPAPAQTTSAGMRFPLPKLCLEERQQASEPEYFWKLAERQGLLLEVNQENREHNAFLLGDWLIQAPDWEFLLMVFNDLYHLADKKTVIIAYTRLVTLSKDHSVDISEVLEDKRYSVLEKSLLKKFEGMFPRLQAQALSCLADLYGPRSYTQGDSGLAVFQQLLQMTSITVQKQWGTHEASLAAHAMSKMAVRDLRLLNQIAGTVIQSSARSTSSMDIWRLAKAYSHLFFAQPSKEQNLRDVRAKLCQTLADGIHEKLHLFSPRRLMQLVGYLLDMDHHDAGLLKATSIDIKEGRIDFTATDLVMFLEHYCRFAGSTNRIQKDIHLVQAVEKALVEIYRTRGKQLSMQIVANTSFGLSALSYYSEELLQRIADLSADNVGTITTAEIVNIASAFVRLGFVPGNDFIDSFNQHVVTHTGEYVGGVAAHALWSLAMFGASDRVAFEVLIQQMRDSSWREIDTSMMSQVYSAIKMALMDKQSQQEQQALKNLVSEKLLHYLEKQQKETAKETTNSKLHEDVSTRLKALGIQHCVEYVPPCGMFSIDIAFKRGLADGSTQSIALEVDGPYHFTWNNNRPLLSTSYRNRVLEDAGWEVWSVPYYEYAVLENDLDKFKYLAGLLGRMGIAVDEGLVEAVSKDAQEARAAEKKQAGLRAAIMRPQLGQPPLSRRQIMRLSKQDRSTRMLSCPTNYRL